MLCRKKIVTLFGFPNMVPCFGTQKGHLIFGTSRYQTLKWHVCVCVRQPIPISVYIHRFRGGTPNPTWGNQRRPTAARRRLRTRSHQSRASECEASFHPELKFRAGQKRFTICSKRAQHSLQTISVYVPTRLIQVVVPWDFQYKSMSLKSCAHVALKLETVKILAWTSRIGNGIQLPFES